MGNQIDPNQNDETGFDIDPELIGLAIVLIVGIPIALASGSDFSQLATIDGWIKMIVEVGAVLLAVGVPFILWIGAIVTTENGLVAVVATVVLLLYYAIGAFVVLGARLSMEVPT